MNNKKRIQINALAIRKVLQRLNEEGDWVTVLHRQPVNWNKTELGTRITGGDARRGELWISFNCPSSDARRVTVNAGLRIRGGGRRRTLRHIRMDVSYSTLENVVPLVQQLLMEEPEEGCLYTDELYEEAMEFADEREHRQVPYTYETARGQAW